jgi:hypothetical protein
MNCPAWFLLFPAIWLASESVGQRWRQRPRRTAAARRHCRPSRRSPGTSLRAGCILSPPVSLSSAPSGSGRRPQVAAPSFFVFFFLGSSVSELVRYLSSRRLRVSCHGRRRAISACSSGEVGSDAVAPTVNPLCFCSIIFLGCLCDLALALDD